MDRKKKSEKTSKKKSSVNVTKLNTTATRVVYWVFEVLLLATMIASIVQLCVMSSRIKRDTQITHILLCAIGLICYNIPSFVQKKFKVYVPSAIHIFVLVFVFAHFVLGEVVGVYQQSAVFDKILHSTSGFAIALIGFSLINLLNDRPNSAYKLNPFFVAFFSFCFALAIALLWEIYEYASDCIIGSNMQRYEPPSELAQATPPKQGYGLIDTMNDIIISTVSALVVSIAGFVVLKRKQELLNRFLMRKISDYDTAIAEAEDAGDNLLAEALRKAKAEALVQIESHTRDKLYPPEEPEDDAQIPLDIEGAILNSTADGDIPEDDGSPADEPSEEDNSEDISEEKKNLP